MHNNSLLLQQRNKPIEPPKQPKPAPFFLPTLTGLVPKFVAGDNEGDIPNDEAAGSKIIDLGKLEPLSEFQKCLENCAATGECELIASLPKCPLRSPTSPPPPPVSPFMELLRAMSPSAIDREFRSLSAEAGGSEKQLHCLLRALLHQLDIRQDFELVQAYLGLVLKVYALYYIQWKLKGELPFLPSASLGNDFKECRVGRSCPAAARGSAIGMATSP